MGLCLQSSSASAALANIHHSGNDSQLQQDRAANHREESNRIHNAYFSQSSSQSGTCSSISSNGASPLAAQLHLSDSPAAVAWAMGLVRSRTFGRVLSDAFAESSSDAAESPQQQHQQQEEGDEPPAVSLLMVPGADLVNHSFDHNSKFEVVASHSSSSSSSSSQAQSGSTGASSSGAELQLVVRALRQIPAGEEVTISYGQDKSNLVLLASYGFVVPGNPNDRLMLPPSLAPLPGELPKARRRCAAAASWSFDDSAAAGAREGATGAANMQQQQQQQREQSGVVPKEGSSGHTHPPLPPITPWHLAASSEEILAAAPQLLGAAQWWRRRAALLALGLEPPAPPSSSASSVGASAAGGGGGGGGGAREATQVENGDISLCLLLCRQLDGQLSKFMQRHDDGSNNSSGNSSSSSSSSSSSARRLAGLAAAQEHALLVRECIAVCKAELAAVGIELVER